MTRVDLLRRLTKSTAANGCRPKGCRPKGYARPSPVRRLLDLHSLVRRSRAESGPTARNAARVTSTTGC